MMAEHCIGGALRIREMQLSIHTAMALKGILTNPNTQVTLLDLSKNLLGDRGILMLAPAISKSKSLTSLALCSNEITG